MFMLSDIEFIVLSLACYSNYSCSFLYECYELLDWLSNAVPAAVDVCFLRFFESLGFTFPAGIDFLCYFWGGWISMLCFLLGIRLLFPCCGPILLLPYPIIVIDFLKLFSLVLVFVLLLFVVVIYSIFWTRFSSDGLCDSIPAGIVFWVL